MAAEPIKQKVRRSETNQEAGMINVKLTPKASILIIGYVQIVARKYRSSTISAMQFIIFTEQLMLKATLNLKK